MPTYKEQLQNVWHEFEKENGQVPATAREAVQWGMNHTRFPAAKPLAPNGITITTTCG